MKETIELLKLLQEKDILISKTSEIIENLPKEIKKEEEKIKVQRKDLEGKRASLSELQKEFRHKERELKTYEDKTNGFKSHMHEIKTKKEFDALEEETKKIRALKEKLEEDCLLLMDTIDRCEKEINDKSKELHINEARFEKLRQEKEKELKEAEERHKILTSSRKEVAGKCDGKMLDLYETIRKNKDNVALAEVSNNTCGICQMSLRPQVINEVREGNNVIRCESCFRILYI